MKKQIVKRFTQFVNENHLDNTIAIGRKAVATAYSGNSNEEMLRLTFSHMPDKEVLISLDSLANVLDPSVLDSTSDEDQETINKALWTRAQEIAKLAGCVALIDNESDEEIDLTGRDSNSGDSDSSMDKDSREKNVDRGSQLGIPTYYRNNPKKLLHILEDEYFTPGSQLAAEIVDEFVNDDSMTIDELAQAVSANATHRGGSPERITKILTMYAK